MVAHRIERDMGCGLLKKSSISSLSEMVGIGLGASSGDGRSLVGTSRCGVSLALELALWRDSAVLLLSAWLFGGPKSSFLAALP